MSKEVFLHPVWGHATDHKYGHNYKIQQAHNHDYR